MESLKGVVEHIVFRNEDNGYTVFSLACDEYDEMTCVGCIPKIDEGEFLTVNGTFVEHNIYGLQMKVESVEMRDPDDSISIERYLASGAVKGIGSKLASAIVERFGEDTFRIIEEEPEMLAEIKGISIKKAMDISLQFDGKRELRRAMLFLQKYGISNRLATRIFEKYGSELYTVISENPYRLAEDIEGVGFKIADEIASQAGIRFDSEFRIRSGILYVLQSSAAEGHCYLPKEVLVLRTQEMLLGKETDLRFEISREEIEQQMDALSMERKIMVHLEGRVYLAAFYHLEIAIARMLCELNLSYREEQEKLEKRIRKIEHNNSIFLDEMQRTAVMEAIRNGLIVITGGPGTGKTTTIKTLIQYFENDGQEVVLAAPTGRAARRMSETCEREASTIHRLLEVSAMPAEYGGRGTVFTRNEENPLEADVVIIDEMSMVDIHLMYALLSALVPGTRLILVGDINQLPSVGPGSILKDMIDSHCFNVVKLTKIFRQAAMSDIIVNAHRIYSGENVDLSNHSKDFFFLQRDDPNLIISNIITLIQEKLPSYVNAPQSEIQVLTPMRKGVLGVERLNRILQEYLNPPSEKKTEKTVGETTYRVGDKVMQIRNDYQLEWKIRGRNGIVIKEGTGVYNGDTGVIREINLFSGEMTVVFEENKEVVYSMTGLEDLELAYAVTIHKAQGSEYPAVILPLLSGPQLLFNRNLLYTAITRAKSCVTLLGSEETVQAMILNTKEQLRYTSLAERIKEQEKIRGVR